jgi:UDP-glucuronate 4-epimerase
MTTILVTGTAGFIGYHTALALLKRGDTVIGVDNFNDYYDVQLKEDRNALLEKFENYKVVRAECSDMEAMSDLFAKEKIDKVCHLAARAGVRYSIEHPMLYEEANVRATMVLLEMAKQHEIENFVFASSSSVYGGNTKVPFSETDPVDHPISPYAATKRSCELIAHAYHHLHGLNVSGLRFFTVYGPWGRPDMALFKFTKAILEDEPIDVYNHGKMKRDFTYIDDIVQGVVAAVDHNHPYEIFNLGNSNTVELEYFIECIGKILERPIKRNDMPMQPGDVPMTYADISKAKKLLGFDPQTNIEDGIEAFLDWYRDYYNI